MLTASQIHGVCFLIFRGRSVLMERCPKKAAKLGVGEWFIPGGKIEGDETPLAALMREVQEEWGKTVINYRALPVVEGSPIGLAVDGLFLMRPYVITVDGDPPTRSGDDIELRWIPNGEALNSPVPQVRMMVAGAIPLSQPQDWECSDCDERYSINELTITTGGQPACPDCGQEVGRI